MKRSIGLVVLMQAVFAAVASANATVTITFTGAPSATPAPSTWMLMGLGLLLAFFVFRKAHSLPGGRTMAALLMLLGVSAYEVFTGNQLASKASAFTSSVVESITGGTSIVVPNVDDSGTVQEQFVNNTGSSITIQSVSVSGSYEFLATPFSSPQCQVGTVLANGGSCYVVVAYGG
jgi:hypothetical protein